MSDLAAHHSAHPPGFAHQFETVDQQRDAGTLGMWVFLMTEIMFFGGMFGAYTIYRSLHLAAFETGSRLLEVQFGATNTVVLIVSSLTMTISARRKRASVSRSSLSDFDDVFGALFLGLKFTFGMAPGLCGLTSCPVSGFQNQPEWGRCRRYRCSCVSIMTGLHAIHMIVDSGLLTVLVIMTAKDRFMPITTRRSR